MSIQFRVQSFVFRVHRFEFRSFNYSVIQHGYLLSYILRTNDLPFFQGEYPKGEGFLAPSPGVEVWGRAKQRGFFLLPDASTKSGDWRLQTFQQFHSSTIQQFNSSTIPQTQPTDDFRLQTFDLRPLPLFHRLNNYLPGQIVVLYILFYVEIL